MNITGFIAGELVGTDHHRFALKRAEMLLLDLRVVGLRFQNLAWQEELPAQLLVPLLPQVRRRDDEDAPFSLRSLLRDDQPGLNGFSKSYLVRKNGSFRQRRLEGKKSRVHLMRIQIDLGTATAPASFSTLSDEQHFVSS